MFNYKVEQCKQSIFEVIENSQLPISVVYYLFKDISNEISNIYNNTLQQEAMQMQYQSSSAEKDNEEDNKDEE